MELDIYKDGTIIKLINDNDHLLFALEVSCISFRQDQDGAEETGVYKLRFTALLNSYCYRL